MPMVRVADFIAQTLASWGIRDVFMVTGGGAMHLNDAIGRERRLRWHCCHHEQACAMAAEGYFRVHHRPALVNVTTGPGGTNAITGVYGAFVDSIAMVVVSGQVKWETTVRSTDLPLRQLGDQEIDIVKMVAPVTKCAVMVDDPAKVRYHLERALHLAVSGRPGPVWLDVPMNVQGAKVDPETLQGYDPKEDAPVWEGPALAAQVRALYDRLATAERPCVLVGNGVNLAGCVGVFREWVEALGIPVTTGFSAHDVIASNHPLNIGRQGTIGDRAGNFAVQNSDLLIVLGARLTIRQISYGWHNFARAAWKVMVDIDAAELKKPTVAIDLPIHADLRDFFAEALKVQADRGTRVPAAWLAWCQARKARYPVVLPSYWAQTEKVNPYCFVDALWDALADDDVVVTGDGTACIATFQAARLTGTQRLFSNGGSAPMGFDLPGAIGAAVAREGKRVVCIAGDGSLQMNVQELQTVASQGLAIKLFVLNNEGYQSIRLTQQAYFPDNPIGYDAASGVAMPDFCKLAAAYGLPYLRVDGHATMREILSQFLAQPGPGVCEVLLDLRQPFAPKTASRRLDDGRMVSAPLEDLAPFLPREEFADNLLIPPAPEGS